MPKKIKFESFKYRFLVAAQMLYSKSSSGDERSLKDFVKSIDFEYENGCVHVIWGIMEEQRLIYNLGKPRFYVRGDNELVVRARAEDGSLYCEDPVKLANDAFFREAVLSAAIRAGYLKAGRVIHTESNRHQQERAFHNAWAESEDLTRIDVRLMNEACTAPEMRHIVRSLGALKSKRLLDVGCGLGEASVYFALLNAEVTASDLSPSMLRATTILAEMNDVTVTPHLAAAEDMQLLPTDKFDVIYAGNLLHHVSIEETIQRLVAHLSPNGKLVTWDPLAYNPVINIYRKIATKVRTPDEHPLTWTDIKTFHKHFETVETRYFWLTTLAIFIFMALVQRRNPNEERFWKVILLEGKKWRWIYTPLEMLDRVLLFLIPPLRLLCWNVVIIAQRPRVKSKMH